MDKPKLLITLGDVAGIGPEIVAKAWPKLVDYANPVVVGDPYWVDYGIEEDAGLDSTELHSEVVYDLAAARPSPSVIPVYPVCSAGIVARSGGPSAETGRAAYEFLVYAIDECLAGRADGIVTCPLHKEGLHAAGIDYPGHTEILADRTGAKSYAMLLYDDELPLAVAHVTLHRSLRSVFDHITTQTVLDKIHLLHDIVPELTGKPARIGVAALNPHASDGGLFGDEEATVIAPAVAAAKRDGIDATGPIASDAIFLPHNRARFDGIVAMYHDQGHIAMKLLGGRRAVNVSAGLPIVRTSVAHGTAFDLAWQGKADCRSTIEAIEVAAKLVATRSSP